MVLNTTFSNYCFNKFINIEFNIFVNGMEVAKIKPNSLTHLGAECNLGSLWDS